MKEILNRIKKNEIKNLYKKLRNPNTLKELEEIDNICLNNEESFIKIRDSIEEIILDLKRFRINENIIRIKEVYESLSEEENSFSILITKFFLISFNDLEKNKYTDDDINNQIIKTRYDIMNFVKERTYFTYLYMASINKISTPILSQKFIIENIEIVTLKIIDTLTLRKIFTEVNVFINGKTSKFIEMPKLKKNLIINLYSEKFKLLKNLENISSNSEYLINGSVFSIYKINKISGKTGTQFILGNKIFIEEINKIKIVIDTEWMSHIFNNYCLENKINKKNIEEIYIKYKEELRRLISEKNDKASSQISKKIAIQYKALIFEKLIEKIKWENNSFYLPYLIDFRGRTYKLSSISPTFFKEIRECLSFSEKEDKKVEKDIKELENKIDSIILKNESKLENIKNYTNLKNLEKKKKISVIWVIISIGEIFKEEIGPKIKIEEFINYAIEKINNYEKDIENIKEEKKNEFIYHLEIIKEMNSKGSTKKLISKDATASVYQHLVKVLGGKSIDSYKYTNLKDPETWYDTYSMIIDMWKKEIDNLYVENKEIIEDLFNRNNLKKTMMTENYGCGRKKCWDYFVKKVKIENEDKDKIKEIFNNFYNYLTKNCIFKKDSKKIIEEMIERKGIINNISDNSRADLMYRKKIIKRINTTYKGKRTTMQLVQVEENCDEKDYLIDKFRIAIRANLVHFLDSSTVREIVKRITCIPIHDCFMVEIQDVSKLIAIANYVMNMNFIDLELNRKETEFFSIFILL